MRYELVIQWPSASMESYDSMIEVENALIAALPSFDEVEGHDVGSGEVNIFVGTDDPRRLLEKVRDILMERHAWSDVRIAYREADGNSYIVLWPKGLQEFKVI